MSRICFLLIFLVFYFPSSVSGQSSLFPTVGIQLDHSPNAVYMWINTSYTECSFVSHPYIAYLLDSPSGMNKLSALWYGVYNLYSTQWYQLRLNGLVCSMANNDLFQKSFFIFGQGSFVEGEDFACIRYYNTTGSGNLFIPPSLSYGKKIEYIEKSNDRDDFYRSAYECAQALNYYPPMQLNECIPSEAQNIVLVIVSSIVAILCILLIQNTHRKTHEYWFYQQFAKTGNEEGKPGVEGKIAAPLAVEAPMPVNEKTPRLLQAAPLYQQQWNKMSEIQSEFTAKYDSYCAWLKSQEQKQAAAEEAAKSAGTPIPQDSSTSNLAASGTPAPLPPLRLFSDYSIDHPLYGRILAPWVKEKPVNDFIGRLCWWFWLILNIFPRWKLVPETATDAEMDELDNGYERFDPSLFKRGVHVSRWRYCDWQIIFDIETVKESTRTERFKAVIFLPFSLHDSKRSNWLVGKLMKNCPEAQWKRLDHLRLIYIRYLQMNHSLLALMSCGSLDGFNTNGRLAAFFIDSCASMLLVIIWTLILLHSKAATSSFFFLAISTLSTITMKLIQFFGLESGGVLNDYFRWKFDQRFGRDLSWFNPKRYCISAVEATTTLFGLIFLGYLMMFLAFKGPAWNSYVAVLFESWAMGLTMEWLISCLTLFGQFVFLYSEETIELINQYTRYCCVPLFGVSEEEYKKFSPIKPEERPLHQFIGLIKGWSAEYCKCQSSAVKETRETADSATFKSPEEVAAVKNEAADSN